MSHDVRVGGGWSRSAFAALTALVVLAAPLVARGQLVRSGTSSTAVGLAPIVDLFRLDLGGGTVAGPNGSFGGMRREINWDGVPGTLAAPNMLPANFFNVNSPRGVVFSTSGTGFQVSATSASGTPVAFGNINPSYPNTFSAFTPERLFTALGSNVVDVSFFVPGTTTPALTRGFGAAFSDVDLANTTSLQFFDRLGASLGIFFVPATAGTQTFSFLGVSFATAIVARVRITNGNFALGAGVNDGGGTDLVVMDDFLYSEPTIAAVPESGAGTAGLLTLGAMALAGGMRRRLAVRK